MYKLSKAAQALINITPDLLKSQTKLFLNTTLPLYPAAPVHELTKLQTLQALQHTTMVLNEANQELKQLTDKHNRLLTEYNKIQTQHKVNKEVQKELTNQLKEKPQQEYQNKQEDPFIPGPTIGQLKVITKIMSIWDTDNFIKNTPYRPDTIKNADKYIKELNHLQLIHGLTYRTPSVYQYQILKRLTTAYYIGPLTQAQIQTQIEQLEQLEKPTTK